MSYEPRTVGELLGVEANARGTIEKVDGVIDPSEQYLHLDGDEGNESMHDVVSHQNAQIRRSESPLFEPQSDTEQHEDDPLLNAALAALSEDDDTPSPPPPVAALDSLKRARAIKTKVSRTMKILSPKPTRRRARNVVEDPVNQAIKTLRQDHDMHFDAIAAHLNKEGFESGDAQGWTAAAIYSRFVRNAPRIAAAQGELGFSPRDYMYLRHPQSHPAAHIPNAINNPSGYQFGAGGGRKRVRDDEHAAQDLADNLRHKCADTLSKQAEMLEEGEMTEMMMEAVEGVEQEFWRHVSNALERRTGKFFDEKVLESRYHAVKW